MSRRRRRAIDALYLVQKFMNVPTFWKHADWLVVRCHQASWRFEHDGEVYRFEHVQMQQPRCVIESTGEVISRATLLKALNIHTSRALFGMPGDMAKVVYP